MRQSRTHADAADSHTYRAPHWTPRVLSAENRKKKQPMHLIPTSRGRYVPESRVPDEASAASPRAHATLMLRRSDAIAQRRRGRNKAVAAVAKGRGRLCAERERDRDRAGRAGQCDREPKPPPVFSCYFPAFSPLHSLTFTLPLVSRPRPRGCSYS